MSNLNPYFSSSAQAAEPAKRTFYVLVRTDIPVEHQLVQAVHAAAEAARLHYRPEHGIASAIVLQVPTLCALLAAQARLAGKGVATELFFEPDFGIGHSALATAPLLDAERKHLRGWPLWKPLAATPPEQPLLQEAA